jgi:hypothetical protein
VKLIYILIIYMYIYIYIYMYIYIYIYMYIYMYIIMGSAAHQNVHYMGALWSAHCPPSHLAALLFLTSKCTLYGIKMYIKRDGPPFVPTPYTSTRPTHRSNLYIIWAVKLYVCQHVKVIAGQTKLGPGPRCRGKA